MWQILRILKNSDEIYIYIYTYIYINIYIYIHAIYAIYIYIHAIYAIYGYRHNGSMALGELMHLGTWIMCFVKTDNE